MSTFSHSGEIEMREKLSIVLPARNEEGALGELIPKILSHYPEAEIILVDDASTDRTRAIAEAAGIRVLSHPYRMGNGAAIKTGTKAASGDVLVFMDSDGQHDPADIGALLEKVRQGFDMAIGARDMGSHANTARWLANLFYNRMASWVTSQRIDDLTSGFRAVRADKFKEFLHLLPNGFSYPTTSTMAFFRSGYAVAYVPTQAHRRIGSSHISPLRDGLKFLLIMFRVGTLYAPLKIFLPISASVFVTGLGYYIYTYSHFGRFTNMSALLFIASLLIFLIGLVSEQITMLLFSNHGNR